MKSRRGARVFALGAALIAGLAGAAVGADGEGWTHVGTGATATAVALNGAVSALSADSPGRLLVGGGFTNAGGVAAADYIATWDGTRWGALGAQPLSGAVNAIAYRSGKVYVGGIFRDAGGNPSADYLAVWDGQRWQPACTGAPLNNPVYALAIVGSKLYVGGTFRDAAGIASADFLVACETDTGAPSSPVGNAPAITGGTVYALAADSRGRLYAGGGFTQVAGVAAPNKVAYLDAAGWHGIDSGTPQPGRLVRSLATAGTDLYVGTDATNVGGIAQADHVVKWNGTTWSALGANTAGNDGWFSEISFIYALATTGSRLFAGGDWVRANGDPQAARIAEFDGSAWHRVGANGASFVGGHVMALATFEGRLYAGGSFANAGGDPLARGLASFPLAAAPGGGAAPPTTTTTPSGGGPPPSGTATGAVTVNGQPFTSGTVPFGATVDVTRGTLVLATATGRLRVNGQGGVTARFRLVRGTGNLAELRLTGGDFSPCPKRSTRSAAALPRIVRQLWGDGTGRFRTRGRYASATVRGTAWLTADRCDGTSIRVRQGTVRVIDLPRRRQITVRAGGTYLARP